MRIGQSVMIKKHPTWSGEVLDVMDAGTFFESVPAVLVLVRTPTTNPVDEKGADEVIGNFLASAHRAMKDLKEADTPNPEVNTEAEPAEEWDPYP